MVPRSSRVRKCSGAAVAWTWCSPSWIQVTSASGLSCSRRAVTEPSAMMRPRLMMRIREAMRSASARSWVVMRMVALSSSTRWRMRSCRCALETGSRPVVGSSMTSSSGRPMSAAAKSIVRRCPPESRDRREVVLSASPTASSTSVTPMALGEAVSWMARIHSSWSATRHLAWSVQFCWTRPTRAQKSAPARRGSVPRTRIDPDVGAREPSRFSTRVVLPTPLGPSRQTTSPALTDRSSSCRTGAVP